jgi:glycosyltransferase involved in cell wall biosynthesis
MHLIIQIPCYNEEESLAETLKTIPKRFPMIDKVDLLVIDDGSTDRTAEIAKSHQVDQLVSLGKNCGLATAFSIGLKKSLSMGADLIVNIDGDNQYFGEDIKELLSPLLRDEVDMVIGERSLQNFSKSRQWLYRIGGQVVRKASGTEVKDPTSGFRAFNRKGAQAMIITNNYTYTLETIIHAGRTGLRMTFVPIRSRLVSRKSRLIKSLFEYILRQGLIVIRTTLPYLLKNTVKQFKKCRQWAK